MNYFKGGSHMETILRRIGNLVLYVADAILEAKDTANSFFFDILLEGKDFNETKSFYPSTNGINSEPRNKV
jgi:hypothetical protein